MSSRLLSFSWSPFLASLSYLFLRLTRWLSNCPDLWDSVWQRSSRGSPLSAFLKEVAGMLICRSNRNNFKQGLLPHNKGQIQYGRAPNSTTESPFFDRSLIIWTSMKSLHHHYFVVKEFSFQEDSDYHTVVIFTCTNRNVDCSETLNLCRSLHMRVPQSA